MLRKEDFEAIGYVGRTHGVSGELACKLSVEIGELVEEGEDFFLMLEEEGLLIPYRVIGHRTKAGDIDLVHFGGIDSREAAEALSNRAVWLSRDYLAEEELSDDPFEFSRYHGYTVFDADNTVSPIGEITAVDDSTLNTLLYINRAGEELLLPIAKELLVAYDDTYKTLHLQIPPGLLEDDEPEIV